MFTHFFLALFCCSVDIFVVVPFTFVRLSSCSVVICSVVPLLFVLLFFHRQRKVLDNLNMNNEDKVAKLELSLAEAQMIAEDSDKKYDEVL